MSEIEQHGRLVTLAAVALENPRRALGSGALIGALGGGFVGEFIAPVHHALETNGLPPLTAAGIGAFVFAAFYGLLAIPPRERDPSGQ